MNTISRRHLLMAGAASLLGACACRRGNTGETLQRGTGTFTMAGGMGHQDHRVTVHYYLPARFTRHSAILMVVPGAGRNADAYRDAWIPHAERRGVLVLSPAYAEKDYDNAAYQMCGLIRNLVVGAPREGSKPGVLYLRDEDLRFEVNPNPKEWLFNDFDRIFEIARCATGSRRRGYDMFGHSAGGQILHRHALLSPQSGARRIVAANAGFYTLPDPGQPLPVGLAGLNVDDRWLRRSFANHLMVLLGENDNHAEKGGQHLHTPLIDRQGTNRLDRGRYFHDFSERRARAIGAQFNWELRTVPEVGHDFRGMTEAAAQLLYA